MTTRILQTPTTRIQLYPTPQDLPPRELATFLLTLLGHSGLNTNQLAGANHMLNLDTTQSVIFCEASFYSSQSQASI